MAETVPIAVGLVGPGAVGRALLEQLRVEVRTKPPVPPAAAAAAVGTRARAGWSGRHPVLAKLVVGSEVTGGLDLHSNSCSVAAGCTPPPPAPRPQPLAPTCAHACLTCRTQL